jgi:hypothetical protein
MNLFSFVYLVAIAAIIASTNGVQADTPVAGVGNEALAETKEMMTTWKCYSCNKYVGTVTVEDTPPAPARVGYAAHRSAVPYSSILPSSVRAANLCNQMFGECKSNCSAR